MEKFSKTNKNRCYICIDLKSFYASVECRERGLDPLTTKLLVADESRTDKTICLAVSPALKAYGIPGRARLFEAKQKLREVERTTGEKVDFIIAPPQMAHYLKVSSDIYAIYLKYIAPEDMHVYSIDEVFINVTDYLTLYGLTAHELTMRMIKDVLKNTGITATAGIGTNLYLAKIAMDIVAKHCQADKDGVRIAELNEQTFREQMWNYTPITDIWRIGPGTAKRLMENGMFTMGDVARMSLINENRLYNIFGIDAEILIDHAWGIEPTTMKNIKNYKAGNRSISSGQVLQSPYPADKARIVFFEMVDSLVYDLVDKGLVTDGIGVDIGYDRESVDSGFYKGETHTDRYGRSIPKQAHGTVRLGSHTSSGSIITEAAMNLFDKIINKNLTIRRLNISANNVLPEEEGSYQYDIFTSPEALQEEKNLQEAMLSIRKKFGNNAVLRGTSLMEGATAKDRNSQIGGHKA
ncbi:DNA methylase [Eubacterium ruminantium]|uniref:Y-family DNA polymerase n=1 Tax=Eubacterium ruminantium TaxID=42322 RepID=UPI002478B209|nr:DNA methylase [Eubacterium ruminantium]